MKRRRFLVLTSALIGALLLSPVHAEEKTNPQVLLETSQGPILLELYPEKAPKSVSNFLDYVNDGFYNGTIFHRVISNFMIQGGGFDQNFNRKSTKAPILNEADNGLRNTIGTISMARTNDPHSATSQFFINVRQNSSLDFREKTPRGWGYAVFGRVIKGMKTVNQIRNQATGFKNGMADVPRQTVIIEKAVQVK
jgi:peptidyl-prolyl cis-trans isomerase B (cyclophilin B)